MLDFQVMTDNAVSVFHSFRKTTILSRFGTHEFTSIVFTAVRTLSLKQLEGVQGSYRGKVISA